jgi:hypothetical protein
MLHIKKSILRDHHKIKEMPGLLPKKEMRLHNY